MRHYKKLPDNTKSVLWDDFATWVNLGIFKKIVIRIATREHEKTGRQVHISEMFNEFVIFDSRERDGINKSGKVLKMNLVELLKASIWNSNQIIKK
jgi:hypothetical protein